MDRGLTYLVCLACIIAFCAGQKGLRNAKLARVDGACASFMEKHSGAIACVAVVLGMALRLYTALELLGGVHDQELLFSQRLGGVGVLPLRLMSVAASGVGMLALYALACKTLGKAYGVLALVCYALLPGVVLAGSVGAAQAMFMPLALLCAALLMQEDTRSFYAGIALGAGSMCLGYSALWIMPVMLLCACAYRAWTRREYKAAGIGAAVTLALFAVFFLAGVPRYVGAFSPIPSDKLHRLGGDVYDALVKNISVMAANLLSPFYAQWGIKSNLPLIEGIELSTQGLYSLALLTSAVVGLLYTGYRALIAPKTLVRTPSRAMVCCMGVGVLVFCLFHALPPHEEVLLLLPLSVLLLVIGVHYVASRVSGMFALLCVLACVSSVQGAGSFLYAGITQPTSAIGFYENTPQVKAQVDAHAGENVYFGTQLGDGLAGYLLPEGAYARIDLSQEEKTLTHGALYILSQAEAENALYADAQVSDIGDFCLIWDVQEESAEE